MTHVFVLTNHKGGVGKSTSATNIALGITSVLRKAGASNARALLIDTDSQGHATLVTTGRNDFGAHVNVDWCFRCAYGIMRTHAHTHTHTHSITLH